jgi:hypothetical protein
MPDYGPLFNYRPMKDLANYMSSYNNATAAVLNENTGAGPDLTNTAGQQCIVNGVHVAALAQKALINLSDPAVSMPDPKLGTALAGKSIAQNDQFYLLVTADADGECYVWLASKVDDPVAAAHLKIPAYNPQQLCISLIKVDQQTLNPMVFGTGVMTDGDCGFVDLVGPNLLPHIDLWDKN